MLTGYNTDIKHEGVIYHVQTEDGGTDNPVIVSLIYQGGRILASRKTSYANLLGTEGLISRLRELLEQQHRAMIKAVLTGNPAIMVAGKTQTATSAAQVTRQPHQPPATQTRERPLPAADEKPPLEVRPETISETPADSAAEKNLDQVILEYLASEIDND